MVNDPHRRLWHSLNLPGAATATAAPAALAAATIALAAAALAAAALAAAALAAAALAYPFAAAVHASADVVCQHVCAGPEWRLPGRWTKLVH